MLRWRRYLGEEFPLAFASHQLSVAMLRQLTTEMREAALTGRNLASNKIKAIQQHVTGTGTGVHLTPTAQCKQSSVQHYKFSYCPSEDEEKKNKLLRY